MSLFLVLGAACRHHDSAAPFVEYEPSSIRWAVTPASATMSLGDTLRARAGVAVRWTSTNPTIATVEEATGLVQARTVGTATIIAASIENPNEKSAMALRVQ